MKKTYIKPEMEVVTLDIEALMLSVSAPDCPPWGGEGSDMEADANGRRGEWGNLWA